MMSSYFQHPIWAAILMTAIMTSCSKNFQEEEAEESLSTRGNCMLKVSPPPKLADETGEAASITYPIQLYVFDQDNNCVSVSSIISDETPISLSLYEGLHQVYALGGVSSTNFNLPTQDAASPTTTIKLKNDAIMPDLMTAQNSIMLQAVSSNHLTLSMERKVMSIEEVNISHIPEGTKAVSVTLSPLYQGIMLNTEYDPTEVSQNIELADVGGLKWQSTEQYFMLPPTKSKATITVLITDEDDQVKTYSYTVQDELKANYKLIINGRYSEALGVTLNGTITGATWEGSHTINFEFDENGSTGIVTEAAPAVGSVYKDCYVIQSTDNGFSTTVSMLPLATTADIEANNTAVIAALKNMKAASSLTDVAWSLLNLKDLAGIEANMESINEGLTAAGGIPFEEGSNWIVYNSSSKQYLVYTISNGKFTPSATETTGHVRAVINITFDK